MQPGAVKCINVKKRLMKLAFPTIVLLSGWMIFAQGCMKFRISDSLAEYQFAEKNAPFKPGYFKYKGQQLHYAESARDSTLPLLVFVHGSPGSWNAFETYMQDSVLLSRYRMISIDRPGFGYSDFGKAQNLNDQSQSLGALLRHISEGRPMILTGHSLGGPVIVKLAADNPDLAITHLVIISGSLDPSAEKPESWRVPLDRTPLRYLVPGAMRPSNTELLLFKQDVAEMPLALSKVSCAVTLLHGDVDDFVPPGNVAFAQQHLNCASSIDTIWFPGERHFIPWTKFSDIRNVLARLNHNAPNQLQAGVD